ncbi:MAG: phosphoribosyltransferase [Acidobacteriota bacterium]
MRAYRDRRDAGRQLAGMLAAEYAHDADVVVLALPRGGVPVGYEIAMRMDVPLDVLVVVKLAVPGKEELAMGALAHGGACVIDSQMVARAGVSQAALDATIAEELGELDRRERAFRGDRPPLDLRGKLAIFVDDGLASGTTMSAAIDAVRGLEPAQVVCAVPVASPQACEAVSRRADRVISLITPRRMFAVGLWYEDFSPTTDGEIRALLDAAYARGAAASHAAFGE